MGGKADEAAGLQPGNKDNDVIRCFRPEKLGFPSSIKGNLRSLKAL